MEIKELDSERTHYLLHVYPEKKKTTVIPFGYKLKEGDPKTMVPDLEQVNLLDQALDSLDNGATLREAADWLSSVSSVSMSHMGIKKIWVRLRPNNPIRETKRREARKKKATRKPLSRQEVLEREKKKRIASEKKKIAFAQKRIENLTEETEQLQKYQKTNVVELDYTGLDYADVAQEIEDEEVEVVFKPLPGPQTEFLQAIEPEVLYGGAAGGGKSFALLADPGRFFDNKHFNGLLLRRTNDELRELIWKSKDLYPRAYPGAEWREKDKEWRFPKGGRLWLTYLEKDDDVLRYQGQAFTWIGFDELTQYSSPFSWNYLRSRLRTTKESGLSPYLSMRATTNPGGPGHGWVKKMFIDPAPAGEAFWATDIDTGQPLVYPPSHAKAGQPLFKRRFIPAKLSDNPYLAEDGNYEAALLGLPEQQRRQLLEGDWGVSDGAAFGEFRHSIHVIEPFEIPENWRKFRSCDFGYSSASAVHWYAVDPEGTLIVYRELYTSKKTGRELARMVLDAEGGENMMYGVLDSSVWHNRGQIGPSIAEEMIAAGCRWRPSDRSQGSRIAGKNRLHELLKVNEDTGKPGILFFNTCRQIISDLPVIPSDPKGGDDIDDRYASDHAYDSIRYGIMSRPRPNSFFDSSQFVPVVKPSDSIFGY